MLMYAASLRKALTLTYFDVCWRMLTYADTQLHLSELDAMHISVLNMALAD
jgi:hypothetical protein